MEHRPLKAISRPLYSLALKLVTFWLLIMAVTLLTARWIGNWVILIALSAFIAMVVIHSRFYSRYLGWVILTTHCPQCGVGPMNYKFSPDSHHHGLLICERCQIEWDLGQELGSFRSSLDISELVRMNSECIAKQIENNEPPETRQTFERLKREGHTADQAHRLLSTAVMVELYHVVYDREAFNMGRFKWNLAHLPREPWDAQGREFYKA